LPIFDFGDVFQLGGEAGDPAQSLPIVAIELVAIVIVRLVVTVPLERLCTRGEDGVPGGVRAGVGQDSADYVDLLTLRWF
jgi:hypothetical protein